MQCCPNEPKQRKLLRSSINEGARDMARDIAETDAYEKPRARNRKKVEMLFAHLKRILKLGTACGYRGPNGAK